MPRRQKKLSGYAATGTLIPFVLYDFSTGLSPVDGVAVWAVSTNPGGDLRRITFRGNSLTDVDFMDPEPSPDGNYIAFSTTPLGAGSATVASFASPGSTSTGGTTWDTNPSTLVTSMQPSWAPDSSKIVYRTVDDSPFQCEIKTATIPGGTLTTLKTISRTTNGVVFMPRYSPDGTKIAYALEGNKTLNVMNADGTGATTVATIATAGWEQGWNFAWLHNSNVLVYQTVSASKAQYRKVNADGTGDTLLWNDPNTRLFGMTKRPVVADDSAILVFARDSGVDPVLSMYSVATNGSGASKLTPTRSSYAENNDTLAFVYGQRVYWVSNDTFTDGSDHAILSSCLPDSTDLRTEFDLNPVPAGGYDQVFWSGGFAGLRNQNE